MITRIHKNNYRDINYEIYFNDDGNLREKFIAHIEGIDFELKNAHYENLINIVKIQIDNFLIGD